MVGDGVLKVAVVGTACCNAVSVAWGRAVINATKGSSWPGSTRARNLVCGRGANARVSRRRCLRASTHAH